MRSDGASGKTWSVMKNVGVQTDPVKEEAQGVSSQDGREAKPKPGKKPDGSGDDPKKTPESPSIDEAGKSGVNKKAIKIAAIAGTAIVAGVGAVVAAPFILGAVGFGSAGIAAGSWAAAWMSSAAIANGGGVAAGSLVAVLQSAGAGGAAVATVSAWAGATGAAAGAAAAAAGAAIHDKMTTGDSTEGGKQERDGEEEEEEAVEDSPGPGRNKRNKGVQVNMKNRGSRV